MNIGQQIVHWLRMSVLTLSLAGSALAESRHVTLDLNMSEGRTTNTLQVAPYETAELVSFPNFGGGVANLWIERGGVRYLYQYSTANRDNIIPTVLTGPAKFELIGTGGFCTFRLTPESYPPDRTILLAPGTNQARITLECSTNLVQWVSATNGVYGPLPEAKFFRIKLETIP